MLLVKLVHGHLEPLLFLGRVEKVDLDAVVRIGARLSRSRRRRDRALARELDPAVFEGRIGEEGEPDQDDQDFAGSLDFSGQSDAILLRRFQKKLASSA